MISEKEQVISENYRVIMNKDREIARLTLQLSSMSNDLVSTRSNEFQSSSRSISANVDNKENRVAPSLGKRASDGKRVNQAGKSSTDSIIVM